MQIIDLVDVNWGFGMLEIKIGLTWLDWKGEVIIFIPINSVIQQLQKNSGCLPSPLGLCG